MRFENVDVAAIACALPEERVASEQIEERLQPLYTRLGLPKGRLELMTGIRERRFWPEGFRPSQAAALAAEKALVGFPRERVGLLAMCSVCRDFLEPATAAVVHKSLGLSSDCMVFDLSNACLGLLTGTLVAARMVEAGDIDAALLVSGESGRSLVDATIRRLNEDLSLDRRTIKPHIASLTIGSGAAAILLARPGLHSSAARLVAGVQTAETIHADLCVGGEGSATSDSSGTVMATRAEELLAAGVGAAGRAWELFKTESGWTSDSVDVFCTHQVGSAHSKLLFERLRLDPARDFPTYAQLGNMGSASCPSTAAMALEAGLPPPGGRMALLGIGSGIVCAMLGLERPVQPHP